MVPHLKEMRGEHSLEEGDKSKQILLMPSCNIAVDDNISAWKKTVRRKVELSMIEGDKFLDYMEKEQIQN